MATVENGEEVRALGQLAVQFIELVVYDGVRASPIEVIGHQALIHPIRLAVGTIGGHLRAVAAVIEHPVLAVTRAVEQPFHPLENARRSRTVVEDHPDVFRGEAAFLEDRTHEEHIVHAAFEPVRRVRVIVDPDEQRPLLGSRSHQRRRLLGLQTLRQTRHDSTAGFLDGACSRCHSLRQVRPHRTQGARVAQIFRGVVVEHSFDVELRNHLLELRVIEADARGEGVVVRIEEMKPTLRRRQRINPPLELIADERVSDLRTEGDEDAIRQQLRLFLGAEKIVADQRAETVRQHGVRLEVLDMIGHRLARLLTQGAVRILLRPLCDHAGRPAQAIRHVAETARAAEYIPDAMPQPAGRQAEHRLGQIQRAEVHVRKKLIVIHELDLKRNAREPCGNRQHPIALEVRVRFLVADAMHTKEAQRVGGHRWQRFVAGRRYGFRPCRRPLGGNPLFVADDGEVSIALILRRRGKAFGFIASKNRLNFYSWNRTKNLGIGHR